MYLKVDSSSKASNLSNLMKDGNWIVLYYANWCGHCNTMKPEWQKVISRMKTHNNTNTNKSIINIADIESSHIDSLINKPEIAGFPTIKMYNSGNEIANFEDERIADKIHQFAILNSKNTSMNMNNMNNTSHTSHKSKKTPKTHKSKKTHKSHKTKKTHKSHKSHKTSVRGSNHRIPPKMIDLNMKNNLRMPQTISKIIGLN
jgi:thiol-disulfide isomerase/thioredoxin